MASRPSSTETKSVTGSFVAEAETAFETGDGIREVDCAHPRPWMVELRTGRVIRAVCLRCRQA